MSPDPGGLPRYPIKSIIIVGLLLLIFQGISEAIKNWAILTDNHARENRVISAREATDLSDRQENNYDL